MVRTRAGRVGTDLGFDVAPKIRTSARTIGSRRAQELLKKDQDLPVFAGTQIHFTMEDAGMRFALHRSRNI